MQIDRVQPTTAEVRLAMSMDEWSALVAALKGKGDKGRRTPQEVKLISGLADDLALTLGLGVRVIVVPAQHVFEGATRPSKTPPAPRMLDGDPPPVYETALS